jgi:hypothetical protein
MAEVEVGAVAPVIPETPAVESAPTPESTADQVTETVETPEAPVEKMLPQSEVNKIVAREKARESRRARAEAEAEFYKRELENLRKPVEAAPVKGEPKLEDYQDVNKFVKDLVAWERQQDKATHEKETTTQREQREMAERAQYVHETVVSKGRAKYDDFDDVTTAEGVVITEPMLAAATKLKAGSDVLYHLGQHPEESARIARLSGIEQAWAMKDLEAKVSAPPKPTQTPAPIVPNAGQARGPKAWGDMSTSEHVDAWLKRKRR